MEPRENRIEYTDSRSRLITQGITSYLDALAAMKEFERLVMEESRKTLASRLHDLENAVATPLSPEWIEDYRNPDCVKNDREWTHTYAWVATKIRIEKYTIYCGLYWDKQNLNSSSAMATLAFPTIASRDTALRKFKEKGHTGLRDDLDPRELSFYEEIDPSRASSFPEKLSALLGKWVLALKAVGGVHGFDS